MLESMSALLAAAVTLGSAGVLAVAFLGLCLFAALLWVASG